MPIVPSTTADDFWEWVAEQGYPGSPNDQLRLLLTAEGYATGNNMRDLFDWLGANGYTGTKLKGLLLLNALIRWNTNG